MTTPTITTPYAQNVTVEELRRDPAPKEADSVTLPDPSWVRGRCPLCGAPVVSNLYYVGGKGYILRWECWLSIGEYVSCSYRKVL